MRILDSSRTYVRMRSRLLRGTATAVALRRLGETALAVVQRVRPQPSLLDGVGPAAARGGRRKQTRAATNRTHADDQAAGASATAAAPSAGCAGANELVARTHRSDLVSVPASLIAVVLLRRECARSGTLCEVRREGWSAGVGHAFFFAFPAPYSSSTFRSPRRSEWPGRGGRAAWRATSARRGARGDRGG